MFTTPLLYDINGQQKDTLVSLLHLQKLLRQPGISGTEALSGPKHGQHLQPKLTEQADLSHGQYLYC